VLLQGFGNVGSAAAEILAPKLFDKNLALTNEDYFEQLRLALRLAASAYVGGKARTAFGHFAAHYSEQIEAGAKKGLNALTANFGSAQIDRAILDALCLATGVSFYGLMKANGTGIDPAQLAEKLPDLDLLSVAHHGSDTATSERFLRDVKPEYAVIQVGAKNPYGHPAPEVLQRLNAAGAAVYRTDTDGEVIFTIQDGTYLVTTETEEGGR
jgi:hypothetical protein